MCGRSASCRSRGSYRAAALASTLATIVAGGTAAGEPPPSASRNEQPGPTRGPNPAAVAAPGVSAYPRAIATFEGKAEPGGTILLRGDGSTGQGLHFRWAQFQGPPVALDRPTAPTARLTFPPAISSLGFLLVVGNAEGVDTASVFIVAGASRGASSGSPRANAGEDRAAAVGQKVTLDGTRSEPGENAAFRWFQVAGPLTVVIEQDGPRASFEPQGVGTYRFALVVASGHEISEPDFVDVVVGPPPPPPVDRVAREMLRSVEGGPAAAEALATIFEALAGRMDFYESYAYLYSEMSRRLDAVVPQDPPRRALWAERLFTPLTRCLIEGMRAEGLDLLRPDGPTAVLTEGQKASLARLFRSMAEGFRSVRPAE